MNYTAEIKKVDKERHQASNTNFLKVEFAILNEEEEEVKTKKIGLSPNTSNEDIQEEVQKHVNAHANEEKRAEKQEKIDKEDENVKELKVLEGTKVNAKQTKKK